MQTWFTTGGRFIFAVCTVGIAVALPVLGDATARGGATELVFGAGARETVDVLVGVVFAVVVFVAHPDRGDAFAVVAFELVGGAGGGWTVLFVFTYGKIVEFNNY